MSAESEVMGGAQSRSTTPAAKISIVALLIAVLLTGLVGIPRFAQGRDVDPQHVILTDQPDGWFLSYDGPRLSRDIGVFSFDIYEYHAYVEYFRGDFDRYPIFGPWRWRMVPSWLASLTPIADPAIAFSVVSLVFLVIGAASLVAVGALRGLGSRGQIIVALLYAISFPTFWYGTSGYVDGPSMALMCLGLYLIHRRQWLLFALLLPVGMLTKETFIIIVPVAATYLWVRARNTKDWLPLSALYSFIGLGTFVVARLLWHSPRNLDWYPHLARLAWNLSRPESMGSFVLSCGVIVPLALYGCWRLIRQRRLSEDQRSEYCENLHLIMGVGLGFLVAVYGFITAYADGRHIWASYPFAITLAAMTLDRWITRRTPEPATA